MEEDIIEEQLADSTSSATAQAPYVSSPQERRGAALYNAIQSFGRAGASSVEEIIERTEGLMNYIENGATS